MPHGLWYPTFDPADVAKQIEHVVANLDTMRAAVKAHSFKTWSTICDELLEDLLMLSGGQEAIVSVPAMLTLPSA
jgi:hypothetical protein